MNWWIIADILGIFVLLPALAVTLVRLIRTLLSIGSTLVPITEDCVDLAAQLSAVPRLAETEMLTGAGLPGVTRYTTALESAL